MYHKDAIRLYRKAAESHNNEFFLCMKGFMYDTNAGNIGRYDPPGSTPFHARRVNGQTHNIIGIGKQHRRIKFSNPHIMPDNLYTVLVHKHNTSTRMDLSTKEIGKGRKHKILKGFGFD
jgi:hypothetical protein